MNECKHDWTYNYPRESVCSKCGMRMLETVKVSDEKINTLIVQMAENTAAIVAVLKRYGNHSCELQAVQAVVEKLRKRSEGSPIDEFDDGFRQGMAQAAALIEEALK